MVGVIEEPGRVTDPPAGWYLAADTGGLLRYWNGSAWTEHLKPVEAGAARGSRGLTAALVCLVVPIISIGGGLLAFDLYDRFADARDSRDAGRSYAVGSRSVDSEGALTGPVAQALCQDAARQFLRDGYQRIRPGELDTVAFVEGCLDAFADGPAGDRRAV